VPIEYVELRKESIKDGSFETARTIAQELLNILNRQDIQDKIREADVPNAHSTAIQKIILSDVKGLGFKSEQNGLFARYACSGLRPDYFNSTAKILFEVERGKTRMNNMDILDLWKCHICKEARYLFLMVPKARPQKGRLVPRFDQTKNMLATFFQEGNHVNVDAVFLFGY
jgi:hypothetical protein